MGFPTVRLPAASGRAAASDPAWTAPGPVTIVNGVFARNGTKKFLLFASYFGALRDAILHPDWLISNFAAAKNLGFDGIRVFPNWWLELDGTCNPVDPRPLIKGNGGINYDPLSGAQPIPGAPTWTYQPPGGYHNSVAGRLQFLLDAAWEAGLIVELAFAGETSATGGVRLWDGNDVQGSTNKYRTALKNVALGLSTAQYHGNSQLSPARTAQTGYRHVIFDVWNEANTPFTGNPLCKPILPGAGPVGINQPPSIANFAAAVKEGDPLRWVTGSLASEIQPAGAAGHFANSGIDYVGHHEPREPIPPYNLPWWEATPYHFIGFASYLGWRQLPITGVGGIDTFPVYFSEPERHRFNVAPTAPPGTFCSQDAYVESANCRNNFNVGQFLYAVAEAKLRGAAAWCFHTEKLFRLGSNYAPSFSQVEDQFVSQVGPMLAATSWPR